MLLSECVSVSEECICMYLNVCTHSDSGAFMSVLVCKLSNLNVQKYLFTDIGRFFFCINYYYLCSFNARERVRWNKENVLFATFKFCCFTIKFLFIFCVNGI